MKKNGFTLIEVLSVIVILSVIAVIAYPKIVDLIESSKIGAYNAAKGNIVEASRIKYMANINDVKVTEYTVDDLISSGYLNKDTKNPITNEDYEDTKVIVTNDGNNTTFKYVSGTTLYDLIKDKSESDGLYNDVYKGSNPNNYISFNGDIYRIIKIDEYRNIYILKDEIKNNLTKDNINEFITSYYNDNYSEAVKDNILSIDIIDYNDYKNSFINDDTYIINNNDIWVKNNEYKVLSFASNTINDNINANTRLVLKLKNTVTIISGDGTQLSPYVVAQ